ncbi:MAG: hypothetical protein AAFZ15_24615 [Bacteroidota bacterium]
MDVTEKIAPLTGHDRKTLLAKKVLYRDERGNWLFYIFIFFTLVYSLLADQLLNAVSLVFLVVFICLTALAFIGKNRAVQAVNADLKLNSKLILTGKIIEVVEFVESEDYPDRFFKMGNQRIDDRDKYLLHGRRYEIHFAKHSEEILKVIPLKTEL